MQSPKRNFYFLQTSQFSWSTILPGSSKVVMTTTETAVAAPPRHSATAARRLVDTSLGTEESADDYDDVEEEEVMEEENYESYGIDSTATTTMTMEENTARPSSSENQHRQQGSGELCTAVGECELCHHSWRVMLEKEDEKIKGEYESCVPHGRRRKFECTSIFQERDSTKKKFSSISEYRPCRYTDGDEQFRMLRMQIMCLLFGIWSFRNVRRLKVVSASLFDLRRMRIQGSVNNGNNSNSPKSNVMFSPLVSKNSMETVELTQNRPGKVPKSPAPDNMSMV